MKIVALICARGNSRGIKNKNLLKFKNTTLLGNSIKQAFSSKYINKVIVSTDSQKIAKESLKNRAEVPFLRPPNWPATTLRRLKYGGTQSNLLTRIMI